MQRAFIFDLDGVMINNEQMWEDTKQVLYRDLFGEAVVPKLGQTMGMHLDAIYDLAVANGATISRQKVKAEFNKAALHIYATAPLTSGLDKLIQDLLKLGYRLGVVSSSPLLWITTTLNRLTSKDKLDVIISLYEHSHLNQKPAPDGYLEAIKNLGATPTTTIILEDSNLGIKSAKAAEVFTIGLKQNLPVGYEQQGADAYANTLEDVSTIVTKQRKQLRD